MMMRRHGWQRPLHPLQIVGASVFSFLVICFYCFLGLFIGNRIAEITVTAIFSFTVLSSAFLFIRCTAIDPTDRSRFKKKKKTPNTLSKGFSKLNNGFILRQIVLRFFRRVERKILKTFIRRKYIMDPWKSTTSLHQFEPLLPPFPFVHKDDIPISPDPKQEEDMSFCSICNFEIKKHSKHCRTCNRCVEGFDHHCRWLNNCVGKKNYTTFILLMIFVLIMLVVEGGTAIAIFVRCFADKKGIEQELERRLHMKFPRAVLATISVFLFLMTAYGSAALGQLFFFHVVLIRKGMRTYDYILAMREENEAFELEDSEDLEDSDYSSDESIEADSPKKPSLISRFICSKESSIQNPQRLSIRIEGESDLSALNKKQTFRASIDPWKLISMSRERALLAASRARDKLVNQKATGETGPLKPLPQETKSGLLMKQDKDIANIELSVVTPLKGGRLVGSPLGQLSSPRRRFSSSPTISPSNVPLSKQRYRSNFDLKLTQVSRELETYISKQVLYSVLKKDGSEASPR